MKTTTKAKDRTMSLKGDKLRIRDSRSDETYSLLRIEDEGVLLGFRFTKLSTGDRYDIDLVAGTCDCIGHTQHGRCKHASAVYKLRSLGMI